MMIVLSGLQQTVGECGLDTQTGGGECVWSSVQSEDTNTIYPDQQTWLTASGQFWVSRQKELCFP